MNIRTSFSSYGHTSSSHTNYIIDIGAKRISKASYDTVSGVNTITVGYAFSYVDLTKPQQITKIQYGFAQGAETLNSNPYDASTNPQGLQNSPSTTRGSITKIRVSIEADYDLDPATQVQIIPYREV